MKTVHPAIAQRVARYFRQYADHIRTNLDHKRNGKGILHLNKLTNRKIKREHVNEISKFLTEYFTKTYPAYCTIRDDDIIVPSRLSSKFEPVINIIAFLTCGTNGHDSGKRIDAFQVRINASRISKDGAELISTTSGIQLNFHAIARMEERGIENTNPIFEFAKRLDELLIYTTIFQIVCCKQHGFNFAIPYGDHLLFGKIGLMTAEESYHQLYIRSNYKEGTYKTEIGDPKEIPLLEIRTAVSYGELTESQDTLREAIQQFAIDNFDDIKYIFDQLYIPQYVNSNNEEFMIVYNRLRDNFQPITRMPSWIKLSQSN